MDWDQIKQQAEQAKEASQRAQGVLQQYKSELKKVWGCSTMKEAKKKLEDLEQEVAALEEEAVTAGEKFEELWRAWKDGLPKRD